MSPTPDDYDPLDPRVCEDPYPYYAVLRREAPVHRLPRLGFFAVSRYADVVSVLRRPELFSSAAMGQAVMRPTDYQADEPKSEDGPPAISIIGLDGEEHARIRGLVSRGFTPARIARLEPRVREIAERLVEAFIPDGECEFVAEYATPLPVMVIAEFLGVDPERTADFKRWADAMMLAVFGTPDGAQQAEIARSNGEMNEYLDELFEERRSRPRPDLVSAMLEAGSEGGVLTLNEARVFIFTLIVAGSVTTTHLIGSAMRALALHPGELAKLTAEPRLIPGMLEEALRYDSPVNFMLRTACKDVRLAGVEIPKNAVVVPLYASANRDEHVFPDPDRFDVTRHPKDHLAFGNGVHFCLGAALARLQARVAFSVLLPRLRQPELAGPVRWIQALTLRGPAEMRLRFEPVPS